jgi:hypothetical protein
MQHVKIKTTLLAAESRNQEKCQGGEGKRKWSEITCWHYMESWNFTT